MKFWDIDTDSMGPPRVTDKWMAFILGAIGMGALVALLSP